MEADSMKNYLTGKVDERSATAILSFLGETGVVSLSEQLLEEFRSNGFDAREGT